MTRYFDGMGNELTSWVEGLISKNEELKLENLKLRHQLNIIPDAVEAPTKRRKTK